MPIHPHECKQCGSFDVLTLSLNAPIDPTCPKCGKKAERRFGVPLIRTNATFFRGAKYGAEQFAGGDPKNMETYTGPARRAGVSITGKSYQSGLARFPGDPRAFVSDLDDARRVAREMGADAPTLGVKAPEYVPKESNAVAEDLLDAAIEDRIEAGMIEARDRDKCREEVADSIAPLSKKGKYKRPAKKAKK